MRTKISTLQELSLLVERNIIHQTESDWLAKGIDNGYLVGVFIEDEKDGVYPYTMTLTKQGEIKKKSKIIQPHSAKIVGIDGKAIQSRRDRRKEERNKK